jgi:acyl carrier protein
LNDQLKQRIANRVKVEVAKIVQYGSDTPDAEVIHVEHGLAKAYQLDSLDCFELAVNVQERFALEDARIEDACQKEGATVGDLIETTIEVYADTYGEREVV